LTVFFKNNNQVPAGTRKLMLTIVTDFLNDLQQRVLQHNTVHKSIMHLIVSQPFVVLLKTQIWRVCV
jgi:hypothetical protein